MTDAPPPDAADELQARLVRAHVAGGAGSGVGAMIQAAHAGGLSMIHLIRAVRGAFGLDLRRGKLLVEAACAGQTPADRRLAELLR